MIDGMETYTYTHIRTDGRKEWRWDSKRGISLSTLFITWHFHQRWRFSFGLGLGDFFSFLPPVHKHAPADPWSHLPSLLVILSFSFFLTLPFIACLYLFPPSIGSENTRNSAHDSRFSFDFLFTYIFSPAALSRKGADDEALNGTSLPYRGEREDDDDRQAGNRFSMWICYTKGKVFWTLGGKGGEGRI